MNICELRRKQVTGLQEYTNDVEQSHKYKSVIDRTELECHEQI